MGYYIRAFCRTDKFPAFREIQAYMYSVNPVYRLEADVDDNSNWTNLEIYYKDGNHPISVEINWCDDESSVGKEELAEFLEVIGPPRLSIKKRQVIKKLRETKFIICNQLLSDLDDDGYIANGLFMDFFVERYKGMIHAENEGFYNEDGKLLL
jgi:hypothetical protein